MENGIQEGYRNYRHALHAFGLPVINLLLPFIFIENIVIILLIIKV